MTDGGQLIRGRREAHGLSQRRLALRAGTSQAAIAAIESGRRSPSIVTLQRLLAALGEELDLEAAVRPSRWRDPDEARRREFADLSAEQRVERALAASPGLSDLLGRARR